MDPVRTIALVAGIPFFAVAARYRLRSQKSGEKLDRTREGWLILVGLRLAGLATLVSVVLCGAGARRVAWADLALPEALRWTGLALYLASLCWLIWMFHTLGTNLTDTVVTRRDAKLVRHGPYRYVRNPMYVGVLGLGWGLGTAFGTWLVPVCASVVFTFMAVRTRIEERYLIERFGAQYTDYMTRVNRFVPKRPRA